MNKDMLFAVAAAALVGLAAAAAPSPANAAADDAAARLILEVRDQQKTMAKHQAQIEARTEEIAEELRLARIFAARSGGKTKATP